MAARKIFGTDGIRGAANSWPVTPEMAMRLGMAAATYFRRSQPGRHLVVIGKDTRLSGYMLEPALTAGFTAMGMDVDLFGPLPTPGVALLTRSLRAELGVMISASHNHYADNGLKLFGPDGMKLSDEAEAEIEALMARPLDAELAASPDLGRAKRVDDSQSRYIEIVKSTFPRKLRLTGLRIVIDCANGAAYRVAPKALFELGAEVFPIGVEPNGFNINREVGSTDTRAMVEAVRRYRADLGIALDGDADRVVMCDAAGRIIDGDQLLGLIATSWKQQDRLAADTVVATVMSNLGLETYLKGLGVKLDRAQVGDRYVVARMLKNGANVGGEQSGHLVLSDFCTTGDGLIAALQVVAAMIEAGKPLAEVAHVFDPAPQKLVNRPYKGGDPLAKKPVKEAISAAEKALGARGRLLVRKSGTEPIIRVMAQAETEDLVREAVDGVLAALDAA
ncbi:MAG: phosphoglucosamine mutase [Hyphomonadaceae bacterium]